MNLMQLAEAEAAAAERRSVAEAVWRSKWWETTVALGELPTDGVGKQIERIAPVLGVSTHYLGARRRLGARIADLGPELLAKVPPRLAIEYVKTGALDQEAAIFLIAWEREDKSLRELATHLGTAGRSWQNKEQLDEREAKPSVEAIRAALADPEVAREVVAHGPTRGNFQAATDSWARETTKDTQWHPAPTNVVSTEAIAGVQAKLMSARSYAWDARRALEDIALDAQQSDHLLSLVEAIGTEVTLLRDHLAAQLAFNSAVAGLGSQR